MSAIEPLQAPETSYKVRARGNADWRAFDTVRMEISVGQPYHEGAKLEAALEWAGKNFRRTVLIIGDLPQRYNLMFEAGLSATDAAAKAKRMGDLWLQRNALTLARWPDFEITRWEDWKRHPDYLNTRWQVGRLYRDNERFRASMIDALTAKFKRGGYDPDRFEEFKKLSTNYLLEESAVFAIAYNELRGISVYPGSFLEMWDMFVGREVPGAPEGFQYAHCARLQFEKKAA